MRRSVRKQVNSGLRLAGGALVFFASLALIAYGLDTVWPTPPGHLVWSAWIGWIELLVAAVLIPLTAHLWLQLFAGCAGFAFLKTVPVIFSGKDWYAPHLAFSRLEGIEMALFYGAALVWTIRFANSSPTIPDRIAITVYLFCVFLPPNDPHFSLWAMAGPLALFMAWCMYHWKRPNVNGDQSPGSKLRADGSTFA